MTKLRLSCNAEPPGPTVRSVAASVDLETRVVVVILRDTEGHYFVHQRRDDKRIYPGLYGLGAGGTLHSDEAAEAGAARELREETGLSCPVNPLFDLAYEDSVSSHVVCVFVAAGAQAPGHDAREWQWSGWLSPTEVTKLAASNQLCPDTKLVWQCLHR